MMDSLPSVLSRYDLGPAVGSGSYGNVFRAKHKLTNVEVAVKLIPKSMLSNPAGLSHFQNETQLLSSINHPFINRMFEVIEEPTYLVTISEFGSHGDFLHLVNSKCGLSESISRSLFIQIVQAVSYLHESQKLVHRDLKLENILLDRNDNVKLIDFGLAKRFNSDGDVFSSRVGSPAYVAPEIITGAMYTHAVDIWSLGVILYSMVTGSLPFNGETTNDQLRSIAHSVPSFPPFLSESLVLLLEGMLVKDPLRRFTMTQIKAHPWLASARPEFSRPHFPEPEINEEIMVQVRKLGLVVEGFEIMTGVRSEGTTAYKILEREEMIATRLSGGTLGSLTASPGPLIQSSPKRAHWKSPVRSLATTPPRQRREGPENDFEVTNPGFSPEKRRLRLFDSPSPRADRRFSPRTQFKNADD
jgi:serine/threonine protein kinase